MNVTSMYVELLVIGLGGLVWLGLLISWGYNQNWIMNLSLDLKSYGAVIIPFVLSAAYVFGILIDKASKFIMEVLGKPIREEISELFKELNSEIPKEGNREIAEEGKSEIPNECFKESRQPGDSKYEEIIVGSESAATVLNYMRSKIRILRGYCFNWLLLGISGFGYLRSMNSHDDLSGKVLFAGIALALITFMLYFYNEKLCDERIERFSQAVEKAAEKSLSSTARGAKSQP